MDTSLAKDKVKKRKTRVEMVVAMGEGCHVFSKERWRESDLMQKDVHGQKETHAGGPK